MFKTDQIIQLSTETSLAVVKQKKFDYNLFPLEEFSKDIPYGEFHDLSMEDYVKIRALNASSLKLGKKSGYHIDIALSRIGKKEEKKEFDLGTAFHYMVFEPEKFWKKVWTRENCQKDFDRRRKDDKEEWENACVTNAGKIYIKPNDLEPFKKMYDALHSHDKISKLLNLQGNSESTYVWKNEEFNLNCKARTDKIIGSDIILDLKTTKDSSEFFFKKDYDKYEYDVQAAFYVDGYEKLFNKKIEFAFIVINKFEPYIPVLYHVKHTYDRGREAYKKYIQKYLEFKARPDQIFDIVNI